MSVRPAFDRTDRRQPDAEPTFPRLQALRSANTNAPCKLLGSGPISCQVENHTSQVQTCHQSSLSRRSRSSEYSRRYTSVRRKRFSYHEPDNEYYLRGYKGSEDFAGFGLDFWTGHDWVGIDLWGPPIDGSADKKNVLGFATYSPKSRIGMTAASLARDAGGIALYHDGRVFTRDGRARPRGTEPMTEIHGRSYHKIAYVDDDQFFDHIMEYHFCRLNSDLGSDSTKAGKKVKGSGMDAGPPNGGVRSSAIFTALHNPLTIALCEQAEALGYVTRTWLTGIYFMETIRVRFKRVKRSAWVVF